MQRRIRNLVLLLLAMAVLVAAGWALLQRSERQASLHAYNAILDAERDVLLGTNDVYAPKEIAAEEAMSAAQSLSFTDSQQKALQSLDAYLSLLRYARDSRVRPAKADNWVAS